jgi:hypothetical protein
VECKKFSHDGGKRDNKIIVRFSGSTVVAPNHQANIRFPMEKEMRIVN